MDPWKFLDNLNIKVYCICLQERQDRYYSSLEEFKRIGLDTRVQYYRPQKNKIGGRIGCWESHKWCITQTNGMCLIFEDDIKFSNDWYTQLYTIEKFLRETKNWNMFYLGGIVCELFEQTNDVSQTNCITTHSYFLSQNCVEYLKTSVNFNPVLYERLQLDVYYYRNFKHNYILNHPICYQDNGISDNNWSRGIYKFIINYIQLYFWSLFFKTNNFLFIKLRLPKYLNPSYISLRYFV